MEDSRKTESAIKAEMGVDAQVGFRTFSGTGGTKVFVSVMLKSPPAGDAATVKTRVTDIVNRNFRSRVDTVDVRF